jgi:ribose transport system substrate-binding protein
MLAARFRRWLKSALISTHSIWRRESVMNSAKVSSKLRISLLVASMILVLGLAACGSDDDDGGSDETVSGSGTGESLASVPEGGEVSTEEFKTDPPWTIGYADASLSNSWRVFAWQYLQAEADAWDVEEVIHANANDSTPKQVADIENLVNRGVDCMIVAATSDTALNPAIQAASQDVPVVIMERAVQTEDYTSFAALNAVDMGEKQAQSVVDALDGEGKIVILEGIEGTGPVTETLEGMHNVLDEESGIEVIATEYTDWSRDEGKRIMENLLQANPQIDAVLADSGLQQVGAFEAVQEAGRLDEIKAWTGDSVQGWMRIVDQNDLPGIVVDRPTIMGANSMALCAAILEGQPVPKVWQTENKVIQPDEITEYIAPESPGSEEWWDWWNLPKKWLPKA